MEADLLSVVALVTAALDRLGVPHAVGGSLASSAQGMPRTTNDADLIADVREEHIEGLLAALEDTFYIAPAAVAEAISRGSSFNVVHYETALKVDVFVVAGDAFRRTQLTRVGTATVGAHTLRITSPEDTILAKLLWYRLGGEVSQRQWQDILGVLLVQGDRLDLEYLRRSAEALEIGDLLARALAARGA